MADDVARALRGILICLLLVVPGVLAATWLDPSARALEVAALAALVPGLAACMAALRAKRVDLALSGVIALLIAYAAVGSAAYGSIRSFATLGFVAAVVVGGLFLGRRALVAIVVCCGLAIAALIHAEHAGRLPQPAYTVGVAHWVIWTLALASFAANVHFAHTLVTRAAMRVELQAAERQRAEAALGRSEDLFRVLFRSSPAALIITRLPGGEIVEINDAYEKMFRMQRSEAVGRNAAALGLWEDAATRRAYVRALASSRRVTGWRIRFRRHDGELFDAVISTEQLEWQGVPHLFSTVTDVSEESRMREALRSSEQRLEAIFRRGPMPVSITRFETGEIVDVNAALERAIAVPREAIIGRRTDDFIVDHAQLARHRRQLSASGWTEPARMNLRDPGGRLIPVIVSTAIIEDGGVRYAINTMLDITGETAARAALEASERRFSTAFHLSPIGMSITRMSDGRILEANQADETTMGFGRGESRGRTTLEIDAWPSPEARAAFVDELRRTGRAIGHEQRRRAKDGRFVDVRLYASLIDVDGEKCILSAALNVTDEKRHAAEIAALNASLESRVRERTAALEAANAEMEAFSYSVSHDLRAPLRSIDGFLALLVEDLRGRLAPDEEEMAGRIRASAQRMGQLIDDLLSLSRLGREPVAREDTDLSALAGDIAAHLRESAPDRVVMWDIAPGLRAQCDAGMARILLENLLGNAWKFSAKVADARIRFGRAPDAGGAPAWFVADNGAGFDMRYADRLFGPFQRMHSRDDFEGTGIGLAIVKRIVSRHGGRIWAEAAPGAGATFRFTLAPDQPDAAAGAATREPST
ncbi:MAG: PAS domain S-box protein [Burkholderiales bacterium]|nr:PAS domain S-box protein [Burkholderiales bacterium]